MENNIENYTKRVPENYLKEATKCGKIEEISYESKRYATDCSTLTKKALVYLPYGYNSAEDKKYKTLYLMHGGGGSEVEFLYGQDNSHALIHIIDHMIEEGVIEPFIIVTPTFYYTADQSTTHDILEAGTLTRHFHKELRNELLPYIEAHYRVLPGRENRTFSGFSMGGETTWETMLNALDLIKNYLPLSGDCWVVETKGGFTKPLETVELMEKTLKDNGFDNLDYNIFAFTGDQDIAFPALDAQLKVMFERGWNGNGNTLRYCSWPEGVHWYPWIYEYMYNALASVI